MTRSLKFLVVIAALPALFAACGDDVVEDAITATDLDAAAESVLDEMQPDVAEQLTVADVQADAGPACEAIASIPNAATGDIIVDRISKPDYHEAVEAEGDDSVDNPEFFSRELPYIVSIGKHFCPAEAVRANVI